MMATSALFPRAMVRKELRTRLRSRHSLAIVTLDMTLVAVVVIVFLAGHSGVTADGSTSGTGSQLFEALAIFQLSLILFMTPASLAAAVSGERQRQTWDLLRVTRLTPFAIVWAKLLAGMAINVLLLAASAPLFAAVFLFGGVTVADVVHMYLILLATVLLLGAASLTISVVSARPVASVVASNVVSMFLGFGLTIAIVYGEMGGAGSQLLGLGSVPAGLPPLTPLAQIDPLVALLSALPNGHGSSLLGAAGEIHHAFGLPLRMQLWVAFCVLALLVSGSLLAVATVWVRYGLPRRSGAA